MIALALLEPALMDQVRDFNGSFFSVPLLGRVYDQLLSRHHSELEVSVTSLIDLSAEEMSHLVGITQRRQGTVNEEAFLDCVSTVRGARAAERIQSDDDLLAFRNKLKESKGTKV